MNTLKHNTPVDTGQVYKTFSNYVLVSNLFLDIEDLTCRTICRQDFSEVFVEYISLSGKDVGQVYVTTLSNFISQIIKELAKDGDLPKMDKHDIRWQLCRMQCKKDSKAEAKVLRAQNYLEQHAFVNDKERVLNYLSGLACGYPPGSVDRAMILKEREKVTKAPVTSFRELDLNFENYEEKELKGLLKDLGTRNSKWCKKGYIHVTLVEFIKALAAHLNETTILSRILQEVEDASKVYNTHKFIY
jgi:hypothetical protein